MHSDHPIADYQSVVSDGTQFVDVREPDEVAAGTLPGTTNIPLGEIGERLGELDGDRRVVVMCKSGGRSTQAAEILTDAGFSDVVNLAGGMMAWDKANKAGEPRRSFRSMFGKGS